MSSESDVEEGFMVDVGPDCQPASRSERNANWCGVLSKAEIKRHRIINVPEHGIHESKCYKSASYDLRLGAECVFPEAQSRHEPLQVTDLRVGDGVLRIQPFSSVIVSTYEEVNIPANVIGKFNIRIKLALRGLIVQMGTQIEPMYRGNLYALLQNISDQVVELKYCDFDFRIFTIEFYYISEPVNVPDIDRKTITRVHQILADGDFSFKTIRELTATTNSNLGNLESRIGGAESKILTFVTQLDEAKGILTIRRQLFIGGITAFISLILVLIVTILPPLVFNWYFEPYDWDNMKKIEAAAYDANKRSEEAASENQRAADRIETLEITVEELREKLRTLMVSRESSAAGAKNKGMEK